MAAIAVLACAPVTVRAGLLAEHLTGSFSAATTLGGVALGADTHYSIYAIFDASANQYPFPDFGIYPVLSLNLTLAGHGTYAGVPGTDLNVFLGRNDQASAGFSDADPTKGFGYVFNFVTPSFDPHAPFYTTFDLFHHSFSDPGYVIDLVGVPGGLVVNGLGSTPGSASITAVPEPTETAAVIGLVLGAFALVRRGGK